MIYGLGTDIIEIRRIEKAIESNKSFKTKIFHQSEIDGCENRADKYLCYAARFAAKEAFFKALGTGWREGMAFNEIVIKKDELGKPKIELKGVTLDFCEKIGKMNFHLSVSHEREYAVATVIIEK